MKIEDVRIDKIQLGERYFEEEMGNRQGERTDLGAIAPKSPEGRTADIATRRAGFTDRRTYERAKDVVERGSHEPDA